MGRSLLPSVLAVLCAIVAIVALYNRFFTHRPSLHAIFFDDSPLLPPSSITYRTSLVKEFETLLQLDSSCELFTLWGRRVYSKRSGLQVRSEWPPSFTGEPVKSPLRKDQLIREGPSGPDEYKHRRQSLLQLLTRIVERGSGIDPLDFVVCFNDCAAPFHARNESREQEVRASIPVFGRLRCPNAQVPLVPLPIWTVDEGMFDMWRDIYAELHPQTPATKYHLWANSSSALKYEARADKVAFPAKRLQKHCATSGKESGGTADRYLCSYLETAVAAKDVLVLDDRRTYDRGPGPTPASGAFDDYYGIDGQPKYYEAFKRTKASYHLPPDEQQCSAPTQVKAAMIADNLVIRPRLPNACQDFFDQRLEAGTHFIETDGLTGSTNILEMLHSQEGTRIRERGHTHATRHFSMAGIEKSVRRVFEEYRLQLSNADPTYVVAHPATRGMEEYIDTRIEIVHGQRLVQRKEYLSQLFRWYGYDKPNAVKWNDFWEHPLLNASISKEFRSEKAVVLTVADQWLLTHLAHRDCMLHFLHSGASRAVILEDDALLAVDFRNKLDTLISQLPEDWDTVFLGDGWPDLAFFHIDPKLPQVVYPHEGSRTAIGYLISYRAAMRAMHLLWPITDGPIDYQWNRALRELNLKSFYAVPPLVSEGSCTVYSSAFRPSGAGGQSTKSLPELLETFHRLTLHPLDPKAAACPDDKISYWPPPPPPNQQHANIDGTTWFRFASRLADATWSSLNALDKPYPWESRWRVCEALQDLGADDFVVVIGTADVPMFPQGKNIVRLEPALDAACHAGRCVQIANRTVESITAVFTGAGEVVPSKPKFLLIDCEGCEYAVFNQLKKDPAQSIAPLLAHPDLRHFCVRLHLDWIREFRWFRFEDLYETIFNREPRWVMEWRQGVQRPFSENYPGLNEPWIYNASDIIAETYYFSLGRTDDFRYAWQLCFRKA